MSTVRGVFADRSSASTDRTLASVLPPLAVGCEQVGERVGWLYPQEAALIAAAGAVRRGDFTAGRTCARQALEALGRPAAPLLRDEAGAPAWPQGVTGSLTHCDGYCAAAVAPTAAVASLGLDAEPNAPLPQDVRSLVLTPAEAAWLRDAPRGEPAWDRLVFSIKESVYKAWSPLTGAWLDFQQVEVALDITAGTFAATVESPARGAGAPGLVRGRFAVRGAHLLACATIPPAMIGAQVEPIRPGAPPR